jgi:hypothetical protein
MTNKYADRLGDYVEVKDRLAEFFQRFPDGSLQSEVVELTDSRVTVKAWAYRTADDQRPGVGHSYLTIPGMTPYTRGSEIENAETSAWGRALVAVGIAAGKGIASRDEIESKGDTSTPRQAAARNAQNRTVQAPAGTPERMCKIHTTEVLHQSKATKKWGHVLPDGTACVEGE